MKTPNLCKNLFPQLANYRWGYLDINEVAFKFSKIIESKDGKNIFLDQDFLYKVIKLVHEIKEISHSYGGWLEDRSFVWSGHYQKPEESFHYGIDLTVPEGSAVYMPIDGELVDLFVDGDQDGGWGGRLTCSTDKGFLILGHLCEMIYHKKTIKKGDYIGKVAPKAINGGWWPHLHVQLMRELIVGVDGYGRMYEGIEKDFLNPFVID